MHTVIRRITNIVRLIRIPQIRRHPTSPRRTTITPIAIVLACTCVVLPGCRPMVTSPQSLRNQAAAVSELAKIQGSRYNPATDTMTLTASLKPAKAVGENIVDLKSPDGIDNYATANAHGQAVTTVEVSISGKPTRLYHLANRALSAQNGRAGGVAEAGGTVPETAFAGAAFANAPRGARVDRNIRPVAGPNASVATKEAAVLRVAKSKLRTPYIWGHNEDRGQYGFDCSNYVAYVFHHALGYRFSGASKVQYRSLGQGVARSNLRVGDVIFFERGAHEGIYIGNDRMIQEGGGMGMVSYMSVRPGSYWGSRISAIRRLF